ncbi:MAG: uracil-DNA glycosylase [Candidatus Omnitrophica bacterium]|nr:uracil-DNA glycosylase [Candidatus Omnitrophota bacterium]
MAKTASPLAAKPAVPQPFVRDFPRPDPTRVADKAARLCALEEPLRTCEACRLCSGRTHLVYGVGNPDTALMFIGEGPGRDEDLQGEPFVGRAGQLLTEMITKGLRVRREDVYIANVVKCRPPENRAPQPDEMEACLPNLIRQIEIIQPKVIVTLGAIPAKALLKDSTGITRLRGNWRAFKGIPVMPTLHPAYLLRNPPAKKDCWEDLKRVIAFLNGELDLSAPKAGEEDLF